MLKKVFNRSLDEISYLKMGTIPTIYTNQHRLFYCLSYTIVSTIHFLFFIPFSASWPWKLIGYYSVSLL